MNCPDKKIINLILVHDHASEYQAVNCLMKCYEQAVAVIGKLGGNNKTDERKSAFNHAMAEFIVLVRKGIFQLTGAAKICTYLTEIARRKWLEFSRKNKMPEHIPAPEEEAGADDGMKEKVKAALRQLTFTDQDILTAFYFYGMPLDEYAEKKRISHDAAKRRISRARIRLKEKLKTTVQ